MQASDSPKSWTAGRLRASARRWRPVAVVVCFGAGFLFVTSGLNSDGVDLRASSVTDLDTVLLHERASVDALQARVADLNDQVNQLTGSVSDRRVTRVQRQVDKLKAAAGFSPIAGPGVTVTLTDAPKSVLDETVSSGKATADELVVHQQDIQAVVNALWIGGAQGITVQGQRIISTTGIKCVGNTVILNGVPYAPPYDIAAIGDADRLEQALDDSPYVQAYLRRAEVWQLDWKVEREKELEVVGKSERTGTQVVFKPDAEIFSTTEIQYEIVAKRLREMAYLMGTRGVVIDLEDQRTGEKEHFEFPEGVRTAENLYAHGIVDAVVPPEEIAGILDRALSILLARPQAPAADLPQEEIPDVDAWEAISRSRRPDRPGVRRLLKYAATDVVPLNGTGQGESDPGLLIALVRFGDAPCVFLGQDRRGQTVDHPMGPEALREARRGMRLAEELGLPLVTVIDTQGAALSPEAENGGLAGEIARCLADLVTVRAPTLCLMLGEGNGGGALAFLPADRVVATQHSWLSPLPPEGASAIKYRDLDHAPEMARSQRVRAQDLRAIGVVDRIVAERPDAADEPEESCRRVGAVLEWELQQLSAAGAGAPADRAARYAR